MLPTQVRIKRLKPITGEVISERVDLIPNSGLVISFAQDEPLFQIEVVPTEHDDAQAVAFDMTFDPGQLCAICVSEFGDDRWPIKAQFEESMTQVESVRQGREYLAAGARLITPGGNALPLYASTLYRGTPLCEFDVVPAIRGTGPYKF